MPSEVDRNIQFPFYSSQLFSVHLSLFQLLYLIKGLSEMKTNHFDYFICQNMKLSYQLTLWTTLFYQILVHLVHCFELQMLFFDLPRKHLCTILRSYMLWVVQMSIRTINTVLDLMKMKELICHHFQEQSSRWLWYDEHNYESWYTMHFDW